MAAGDAAAMRHFSPFELSETRALAFLMISVPRLAPPCIAVVGSSKSRARVHALSRAQVFLVAAGQGFVP